MPVKNKKGSPFKVRINSARDKGITLYHLAHSMLFEQVWFGIVLMWMNDPDSGWIMRS